MAVKVCDAIMGSGKSQSAIAYMNTHPEQRFVYITPYIEETERIQGSCRLLNFITPSNALAKFNHSKIEHTRFLLKEGRNITTTHQAFKLYTEDMIQNITKWGYTLIIDEDVDVLTESQDCVGDVDVLVAAGLVTQNENGQYQYNGGEYKGVRLADIFQMLKRNNLTRMDDALFFWELHADVFKAFKDVFVLTYLFDGQDMKYFLESNGIEYSMIGVRREDDGSFHFDESNSYRPAYTRHLSDMIHICEHQKINSIGDGRYALSSSWYSRCSAADLDTLKRHLYNYIHNIAKAQADDVMWTTFKDEVHGLRGRGYSKQFVQCSIKASNAYRSRTVLAYCVNVFSNPYKKKYINRLCSTYDEDMYALSSMIQWIWRSAIRDGKDIYIYIPSERMRGLLRDWIKTVEEDATRLQ